jgi:hypothetical protein
VYGRLNRREAERPKTNRARFTTRLELTTAGMRNEGDHVRLNIPLAWSGRRSLGALDATRAVWLTVGLPRPPLLRARTLRTRESAKLKPANQASNCLFIHPRRDAKTNYHHNTIAVQGIVGCGSTR